MDIETSKLYKFKGSIDDLKEAKLMKYIDTNMYFSGSVEFGKSSTIIFKSTRECV